MSLWASLAFLTSAPPRAEIRFSDSSHKPLRPHAQGTGPTQSCDRPWFPLLVQWGSRMNLTPHTRDGRPPLNRDKDPQAHTVIV